MADFERTTVMVGGRSVIMTSWFDETKQSWRASAPSYTHLGNLIEQTSTGHYASRQAAVARLSHALAAHFEGSMR